MADPHPNFGYGTVATAPAPALTGTSLILTAGQAARFLPTGSFTAPFNVTIWPAGAQPLASNTEIVRVTGITGDTLSIQRTQESSTARTIVAGDQVAAAITRKTLTDVEDVPNIYMPPGALTQWMQDKVLSNTKPVGVALLGGSISQGFNATDMSKAGTGNSYWELLIQYWMAQGYGRYGDWIGVQDSTAFNAGFAAGAGTLVWSLVPGGGALTFAQGGFDRIAAWTAAATNFATAQLTLAALGYRPTDFDVLVAFPLAASGTTWTFKVTNAGSAGSPITVAVVPNTGPLGANPFVGIGTAVAYGVGGDPASTATVTITNPTPGRSLPYGHIKVSGMPAGLDHVVTFATQSADNACMLAGIFAYAGLRTGTGLFFVHSASFGQPSTGWTFSSLMADRAGNSGRTLSWQGFQDSQQSDSVLGQGANPPPMGVSLLIIDTSLIGNDGASSPPVSWAVSREMLARTIRACRRAVPASPGNPGCSVMFIGVCETDSLSSEQTSGYIANSNYYEDYLSMCYQVALDFNCAFVDIYSEWGETPVSQGYILAGNVHPLPAGHLAIKNKATTLAKGQQL